MVLLVGSLHLEGICRFAGDKQVQTAPLTQKVNGATPVKSIRVGYILRHKSDHYNVNKCKYVTLKYNCALE